MRRILMALVVLAACGSETTFNNDRPVLPFSITEGPVQAKACTLPTGFPKRAQVGEACSSGAECAPSCCSCGATTWVTAVCDAGVCAAPEAACNASAEAGMCAPSTGTVGSAQ